MEKAYVFVVCGAKEHIDTLHFSLKSFKKNTSYPKLVITDRNRNEIPIIHDHIIHVDTPKEMDHHQASIFLKTSIHKYLPNGGQYVYMDSDILAIGSHCDSIFEEYIPPIRFAADHCKMSFFSPSAMNCSCREEYDELIKRINTYVDQLDHYGQTDNQKIIQDRDLLKRRLLATVNNKKAFFGTGIRGFFSWPIFKYDKDFKYHRRKKIWYNAEDEPIMFQVNWAKVAKKFDLKFDYFRMQVKDRKGKSMWECRCDHLPEAIEQKFKIPVKDKKWQHWNGGVFLFDDRSHEFLNFWHNSTMEIFKDPYWKTRDQGTLIATVWKFGLQNHPLLDEKWNNICDYHFPHLSFRKSDKGISKNGKDFYPTEFAHVYHHFGDLSWNFWNAISEDF